MFTSKTQTRVEEVLRQAGIDQLTELLGADYQVDDQIDFYQLQKFFGVDVVNWGESLSVKRRYFFLVSSFYRVEHKYSDTGSQTLSHHSCQQTRAITSVWHRSKAFMNRSTRRIRH